MIPRNQLYVLNYYKKNTYMGSDGPLYYRIYRVEEELESVCWPGPFIYDKTPEERKHYNRFPYTEDGMNEVIAWLDHEVNLLRESEAAFLKEDAIQYEVPEKSEDDPEETDTSQTE